MEQFVCYNLIKRRIFIVFKTKYSRHGIALFCGLIFLLTTLSALIVVAKHSDLQSVNRVQSYGLQFNDELGLAMTRLQSKYRHKRKALTDIENLEVDRQVDSILASNLSTSEKDELLLPFGVIRVDTGVQNQSKIYKDTDISSTDENLTRLGTSDVHFDSLLIYYNSGAGNWILNGGGYISGQPSWKAPFWSVPTTGDQFDVGGLDGFGISLHDTFGSFDGVSMVSGSATFSNPEFNYSQTTQNRVTGASSYGAGFLLQDKVIITKWNIFQYWWTFLTRYFSVTLRYSSNFSNYRGNAVTFYAHSWQSTSITGIGLSIVGFDISWSGNDNEKWKISPTIDTPF